MAIENVDQTTDEHKAAQLWTEALAEAIELAALAPEAVANFIPPTPIDCYVLIAGERVNGGEDADSEEPVVLTGLEVSWGRDSSVDQPSTATASFTIEDRSGDRTFAKLASVGQYVEVRASAIAWDTEGSGIQTLPSWDGVPVGSTPPNVTPSPGATTRAVINPPGDDGTVPVLRVNAADRALHKSSQVVIAPRPRTTDVTAWDDIPQTQVGQQWRVRIEGSTVPLNVILQVGIARFRSPSTTAPDIDWFSTYWNPQEGAFKGTYTPKVSGEWLGVAVRTDQWTSIPWQQSPWTDWPSVPLEVTWDSLKPGWTLPSVELFSPSIAQRREVLVFAGRISDAVAEWNIPEGAAFIDVTAVDLSADLANRDVGANPWGAEPFNTRVGRILAGGGLTGQIAVNYTDSPQDVFNYQVTRMDVDRQQVWSMLTDLASGVDVVTWIAVHLAEGPFLLFEDMAGRAALLGLRDDGMGHPEIALSQSFEGLELSACQIELEPVRWSQTTSDIATRVVIYWQDQNNPDGDDPVERSVEVRDAAMESRTNYYGVRRVSISSDVTSAENAQRIATVVLARLSNSDHWMIDGVHRVVEPDESVEDVNALLDLLDGTRRIGLAVKVTDLPDWSPVDGDSIGVYLEGGRYAYDDGRWDLELTLSNASGIGTAVTWEDMGDDPAGAGWSWNDFKPTGLDWIDLVGVGI